MKKCRGCDAVVLGNRSVCPDCLRKVFDDRAIEQRKLAALSEPKKGPARKNPKVVEAPTEGQPDFIEDSPRYESEYEARWSEAPARRTGKTTAIALTALAEAITSRNMTVYVSDHYEGRSGQTALLSRIESIARAIGWPIEIQPERGSYRVQICSRFIPDERALLAQGFSRKEYKTIRRSRQK